MAPTAKKPATNPNYITGLKIIEDGIHAYQDRGAVVTYSKRSLRINHQVNDRFMIDCFVDLPKKYTARGLYLQKDAFSQSKLITCLKGCVAVFAVDLRKASSTFRRYNKFVITNSPSSRKSIYIPRGVAYGYISMEDDTELMIKFDNLINHDYEEVFNLGDSDFMMKIQYPDKDSENVLVSDLIMDGSLIISARDKQAQFIWEYQERVADEHAAEVLEETLEIIRERELAQQEAEEEKEMEFGDGAVHESEEELDEELAEATDEDLSAELIDEELLDEEPTEDSIDDEEKSELRGA